MNEHTLKYWLALHHAPGVGPARFLRILEFFPDLAQLFTSPSSQLEALNFPASLIHYLRNPDWQEVEADLNWAAQANHHIIRLQDAAYPSLLKQIHSAPPLLFVEGQTQFLLTPQLAIVGSRAASKMGLETAYEFAKRLVAAGLSITSGLALGIDQAAHRGALAANGKTIAVLGTGLNCIYPRKHQALAAQISAQGALMSEFPLNTRPLAPNFPQRNRIISGLSLGSLVVEASLCSGSLITARYAVEQGREVFAIPGSIHHPLARGCHWLLRQGAKLVEQVEDVLEEISPPAPRATLYLESDSTQDNPSPPLAEPHRKLLECIGYEPTPIDNIVQRSGLSIADVSATLLLLELQGCISSSLGGYLRVRE